MPIRNTDAMPIYSKSLGIDKETGLEVIVNAWDTNIQAGAENVNVEIEFAYLSPTGVVMQSIFSGYNRFNRPAVLYTAGETITSAVLDDKGKMITPAVISDGTEVKVPENMKFNLLRESAVGQMIAGMIKADIESIKSLETAADDLRQD